MTLDLQQRCLMMELPLEQAVLTTGSLTASERSALALLNGAAEDIADGSAVKYQLRIRFR